MEKNRNNLHKILKYMLYYTNDNVIMKKTGVATPERRSIMSQTVCNVCGTSYPTTSTQCPVCGCTKNNSAMSEDMNLQETAGYAYVKGGRFSQANVRKRNSGRTLERVMEPVQEPREVVFAEKEVVPPVQQYQEAPAVKEPEPMPVAVHIEKEDRRPDPQQTVQPARQSVADTSRRRRNKRNGSIGNVILLIIVILLVAAIVAVCGYLAMKLAGMYVEPSVPGGTSTTQSSPSNSTSSHHNVVIPCTSVRVQVPSYTFSTIGQKLLLEVTKTPANTTEPVMFESSDPYVATVDAAGKIVAVAKGTAIITIRCGESIATCEIVCNLNNDPEYPTQPPATTDPTQPSTPPYQSTNPAIKLELNRKDFTLSGYGTTHNLYNGPLDPASIVWTSSDENVATVVNGLVTAVGDGWAVITAVYQGQTVTCDVHCNNVVKCEFKMNKTDVTVAVGESFKLRAYQADASGEYILDENGSKIRIDASELKFYVDEASEGYISVDEKGNVTALNGKHTGKVYIEYKGMVLECIVRVKAPTTSE